MAGIRQIEGLDFRARPDLDRFVAKNRKPDSALRTDDLQPVLMFASAKIPRCRSEDS